MILLEYKEKEEKCLNVLNQFLELIHLSSVLENGPEVSLYFTCKKSLNLEFEKMVSYGLG